MTTQGQACSQAEIMWLALAVAARLAARAYATAAGFQIYGLCLFKKIKLLKLWQHVETRNGWDQHASKLELPKLELPWPNKFKLNLLQFAASRCSTAAAALRLRRRRGSDCQYWMVSTILTSWVTQRARLTQANGCAQTASVESQQQLSAVEWSKGNADSAIYRTGSGIYKTNSGKSQQITRLNFKV